MHARDEQENTHEQTKRNADLYGMTDRGSLEVGKRADIVAMPGNPVDDINAVMKVDFVMKDGTVHRQPGAGQP